MEPTHALPTIPRIARVGSSSLDIRYLNWVSHFVRSV